MFDTQLEFCTFSDFLQEHFIFLAMHIFVNALDLISDSKKTKKKENKTIKSIICAKSAA